MRCEDLPCGSSPEPLDYPHFPTRLQAVIWRMWGLVPVERLAKTLKATPENIQALAVEMGLASAPGINPKWLTHGYLTIIRSLWQLLPYSQILEILEWTPEKMAYTLKEEDFFWTKVGALKPNSREVVWRPLTEEEKKKTAELKALLAKEFPEDERSYIDPPFAFADRYAPRPQAGKKDRFDFNYIHSYAASCGDVLGNAAKLDPVPENLLSQYASMGIKGVWMHAILYTLVPIPGAEEYSTGWEKRLANLKNIVDRCAKYGVKVYLYLNEPRCMPMSFYDKKPHWAGLSIPRNNTRCICTTASPEPLAYLEMAMEKIFTEARGLGGAFCITMSENATNCHFRISSHECPSCRNHLPEKIIADVIAAMERGMHKADPSARMLAYDWAWKRKEGDTDNAPFKKAIIDLLPKTVGIVSVSEWGMITHIGGVEQYLVDYSISQVGPSDLTLQTWKSAKAAGLPVVAKVQINNSWELSAVPYIPVPYIIDEHLNKLKALGVDGLMLSWTLGGFPGGNLDLLKATPEEIAASKYNPALAEKVCGAWKAFSDGFRQFPFYVGVLYNGPMNYGPMNLLHLEKTNYKATMVGFPYDDLETWRGVYPPEVLQNQFRLVTEGWQKGLAILEESAVLIENEKEKEEFEELRTIATAAYCHLRSTYLQISFVLARDNKQMDKLPPLVEEEIALTRTLYNIVRRDSRIGFEASNHYYYTLNDLREKIISCRKILEKLG